jgi:hypothetical protein
MEIPLKPQELYLSSLKSPDIWQLGKNKFIWLSACHHPLLTGAVTNSKFKGKCVVYHKKQ